MTPQLIGITGGSACGKTTLLKTLASLYPAGHMLVLHMDHYYLDRSHLPEAARKQNNFDHPDAIEHALLIEHVSALKVGQIIQRPTYDFATHSRTRELTEIHPVPLVVIDGIFSLHYESLRDLLDYKVFVHLDDDLRFIRRLNRDTRERSRTPEQIISQYLTTVRPMHKAYIEPTRDFADLILSGEARPDAEVLRLKEALDRLV